MFKVYFPFQWLVKGIFLVLLGLILSGSYLTIKTRHSPEERPIKIVTIDLKIGETYQVDGVELTFEDIEVTEKRNESVQHGRVLQVTYTLKNDIKKSIRPQQWPIGNKDGEELYEYAMILDNSEYIENDKVETINYYYELLNETQDYQTVLCRANGYLAGLPFTLQALFCQ